MDVRQLRYRQETRPACRGRKVEKQPITLSDLQRLLKKTEASADERVSLAGPPTHVVNVG